MTVKITDCIAKEKAEQKSTLAKSSVSLDTEIDCSVLVLGIDQKTVSAEVMLEKETGIKMPEGIQSKVNSPAKEMGQQTQHRHQNQLFDFVHIRFQNSGIVDGPRVFRLAFEQTKPGGWIEVVEVCHSVGSFKGGNGNSIPNQLATHISSDAAFWGHASSSAFWVKKQLLAAGFVDVEEKSAFGSSLSFRSSPLQRLWALGRVMKGLCTSLLRWDHCNTGNAHPIQEKSRASLSSPSVFVVARKPPLNS